MAQEPSFEALMDRLRRGEAAAAGEIFRRFARRLIGLARQRLDRRVRQKVDAEDLVQSALKSFFCRYADGQYDLDDWDSLWSLLTVITLRKCGHRVRHFRAECRDVRRETPPPSGENEAAAGWEAIAREPTPEEAARLAEAVEQLFRGLDAVDRRILELSLQGYKAGEVAEQVSVSKRTVYRLLERVKGRLERMGANDSAGP
jgi:RNA polymerase sigma-70 factor (ECF subfamily)